MFAGIFFLMPSAPVAADPPPVAQVVPPAETAEAPQADRSYLFVVTADNARMEDGRLMLSGLADDMSYFTDRPYRESGRRPLVSLLEHWNLGKDSFAADPPNAVLVSHDREREPVIIEIMNPVLEDDTLIFDTVRLDGKAADDATRREGPAVLIIDTCIGISCW